jgi:hypothetical protein
MSEKRSERAKRMPEPSKTHGNKTKPEKPGDKNEKAKDTAQDRMMVPEKQGGIAGP